MKNTVFNKNVYIEYPDSFYEMNADEMRSYFAGDMLRFGARDAEKHIVLSVGKTKDSIANLVTDAKSVLAGAESSLKKGLLGFTRTGEFEAEILGGTARGIRFEYNAANSGARQFCEMAIVKSKRSFYAVYCMSPLDGKEENASLFASFRDSLKFVK